MVPPTQYKDVLFIKSMYNTIFHVWIYDSQVLLWIIDMLRVYFKYWSSLYDHIYKLVMIEYLLSWQ